MHVADIKVMSDINRVQRESQVRIKSEIARIEQIAADLEKESVQIKREFGAFWTPTHDIEQLTASELDTKIGRFKQQLNGAIKEMKLNLTEPCDKREYYQKWLLNRHKAEERESLDRPLSKAMSRRESSFGGNLRRSNVNRRPSMRTSKLNSRASDRPVAGRTSRMMRPVTSQNSTVGPVSSGNRANNILRLPYNACKII